MDVIKQRLQYALDATNMAIWDSSCVGCDVIESVIHWSATGARLVGLAARDQDQPFREYLMLVHPDDRASMLTEMQARVDECGSYEVCYRIVLADGRSRWIMAKAQTLSSNGSPVGTLGILWDDNARKMREQRLFEQKELAELTLSSIGDAVIATDACGKVRMLNRVAEQMTGWSEAEARGQQISTLLKIVDELSGQALESSIHRCLNSGQVAAMEGHCQLVSRDGNRISVEDSVAPIRSREECVVGAVAVLRDVSHDRELAHEVRWHASHDALTGLTNRREFERLVEAALASAREDGHHHALLYLDLDRFKIVNDTCGHAGGDALLQTLARLLQSHMRESDVLARLGGDELGVLFRHCPLQRALSLAEGLRQTVEDFRFVWAQHTFELGVSIGMVEIAPDSTATTELLMAADQACYLAKERGRNRIHVYEESDASRAQRRGDVRWVSRLNQALSLNSFELFSQPIVSLGADEGGHEEVLLRLRGDENELVPPGAFIPAAERYDLMASLDKWVISSICEYVHNTCRNRRASFSDKEARISFSVNLSGMSLTDGGMLSHIYKQFERHAIDPRQICFEITETAAIANLTRAQDFMHSLRQLGCTFSLDDFGSGFSSFAYLRVLPVDYLKIDGVFIRDIANNPTNQALVKAINDVGHVMGIRTVAEFVEDEATLSIVRAIGIDYAQGYRVGLPHPLYI